ncbi:iron chelate uptake ABC transporter family permease subunit [Paenibacillus glufosinatiresistens]|uniref:iron chelate uptake ABC transporter family permease subunit n=1 Tax=Paenibacillus glufosinatiresistens TaxID=3070657 RepID=UPI00286E5C3B|nr:iron chelate uptake ABC transporter family permease subunit [Paenibacillus sp. YX.27]
MNNAVKISLLSLLSLALISLFLFTDRVGRWDYIFPLRLSKIAVIAVTGAAIAYSTLIFQTVTNNRILTPSIIGLDSLYTLVQTFVVFVFGSASRLVTSPELNFLLSAGCMLLFVGLLYRLMFKGEARHIYLLLLVGLVMGTLFGSLSTFMQVLIDPNEFLVLQGRMFASFNRVNTDLLPLAIAVIFGTLLYGLRDLRVLDVLSLGREHALNLGVPYDRTVKRQLVIASVLVSLSTALVGPITFLGLLVVNIVYPLLATYRHGPLLAGSILTAIAALAGGQLLVERVFTFSTTISVIVNFAGGAYFLFLLLRENRV